MSKDWVSLLITQKKKSVWFLPIFGSVKYVYWMVVVAKTISLKG